MSDHPNGNSTPGASAAPRDERVASSGQAASRRTVLKSGAGFVAGGLATQAPPGSALAQDAPDAELSRLQGQRRILIKGAVVLTQDRQVGDFARADILIEDGKIRDVRPDIAAGDTVAVDANNRIAIPGFVDTHSHSYQGLLRGIMPNGRLDPDYNRDVQANLTPAYAPADVYAGVLMTALGLIDMGTTAIVDLSQIGHTPEHSDACIRALQDSGIRAVFAYSRGLGPLTQYPRDLSRLQRTLRRDAPTRSRRMASACSSTRWWGNTAPMSIRPRTSTLAAKRWTRSRSSR